MNDGARTRDIRLHKPALYQLSYAHHVPSKPGNESPSYYSRATKFSTTDAEMIWTSLVVGPGPATNAVLR